MTQNHIPPHCTANTPKHGSTNKSLTNLNAAENKFDTGDLLQMGKTTKAKPYRVNLRSLLPIIHYYQPTVKLLPQYPIGLVM